MAPPHIPWECLRFLQLQHLQPEIGNNGEGIWERWGEEAAQKKAEKRKSGREGRKRSSLGRTAGKRERKEIGEEMERLRRNISKSERNLNALTKVEG